MKEAFCAVRTTDRATAEAHLQEEQAKGHKAWIETRDDGTDWS